MTILETDRLTIRNFAVDDWPALHGMICQYQASELATYDQSWPTAPDEIKKIAEWFAGGDSYLAVCLKPAGQLIGFVALNCEQEGGAEYNLGYVFNFDYHGRGYATEACRAVLRHAFERLQAQRILAGTAAANRASCRVLEKLGFERTAEAMCSFRNGPDGQPIEFLGCTYVLGRPTGSSFAQEVDPARQEHEL